MKLKYTTHTCIVTVLLLITFSSSSAQDQRFHRDCGSGQMLADNGSCRPVVDVLSASGGRIYWVAQNHPEASDANPGTRNRPWRTISRATRLGVMSPGDAVIIRQGVYREEVRPRGGGSGPNRRISFVAYPGDDVVVSGADIVRTQWERQGDGSWYQRWRWEPQRAARGEFRRLELRGELFVDNGRVMTPVGSRQDLKPGSFYVDGSDTSPRGVYLVPFNNGNPNNRRIEVGQRETLFATLFEGNCGNRGEGFYRLVGLTFSHSTAPSSKMAVCSGSEGALFEEIRTNWNNGGGLKLVGSNHLVRGIEANHNGTEGLGATRCNSCTVEYSEISYNNWRADGFAGHGGAGKWTNSENSTIRYNRYVGNNGSGIWLDMNNFNNEIYGNYLDLNYKQGIFLEWRSSRNRVYNNVVTRTRYSRPIWAGHAIVISASSDNLVAHNTLMMNDGSGIRVHGDSRSASRNNAIYNNLLLNNICAREDGHSGLREITILGGGSTRTVLQNYRDARSNRADGNAYDHRPRNGGNRSFATFFKSPQTANGGPGLFTNDIAEWRRVTGNDPSGIVTDPGKPSVVNTSDYVDGWRLASSSQFIGKAVDLPRGVKPITTDFDGNPRPSTGADIGAHQFGQGGSAPANPGRAIGVVAEVGDVTVGQPNRNIWHKVQLKNSFTEPVVVMGPVSYRGHEPALTRVRNVTSNGFEFKIDEWAYLDGWHMTETMGYLVVEAGSHDLGDGRIIQAGTIENNSRASTVRFEHRFSSPPVVFSQVVSDRDNSPVTTRQRSVSRDDFSMFLQGEQASRHHGVEQVAWVAVSAADGKIGDKQFEVGRTPDRVDHRWYSFSFKQRMPGNSAFFAQMQTTAGMDPAVIRYRDFSRNSVRIKVEEEQSADEETFHAREAIGFAVFEAGLIGSGIRNQTAEDELEDGQESAEAIEENIAGTPVDYALHGNYPNPFNPSTVIQYDLPERAEVLLEVFDVSGRRINTLVNETQAAGTYHITFDAGDLPSGLYLYRVNAGPFSQTGRMLFVK